MKNRILGAGALNADLASLILRLMFGALFIYHGYGKLAHYGEMRGGFMDFMGLGPTFSLILVIFAEFFCGIFIVLGLFTHLAAIPVFITMAVAYFMVHGDHPFEKKELVLVYMILSVVVFLMGAGKYSLDHYLFSKNKR